MFWNLKVTQATFIYHIKKYLIFRRHSQEYRFVCEKCEKGFTDKKYLRSHACGVSTTNRNRLISSTRENKCFYIKCHADIRNRKEEEDHLLIEHFKVLYIGLLRTETKFYSR